MKKLLFMAMAIGAIAACRGQTSEDPPIVPIRNMYHQPKYEMQQEGAFFEDGRAPSARRMDFLQDPGAVSLVTCAEHREEHELLELAEGHHANIVGFESGSSRAVYRPLPIRREFPCGKATQVAGERSTGSRSPTRLSADRSSSPDAWTRIAGADRRLVFPGGH